MSRYRYRIDSLELDALKELILENTTDEPVTKKLLASIVKEAIPIFVETDPYWEDKLSTACQRLRREGKIEPVRLKGGRGKAWRGWRRKS